ncbi:MAG: YqgE/AlgH family protein [Micropepsaceae bacterium]
MGLFGNKSKEQKPTGGYLEGQVLIAMPSMPDPKFSEAVVFLCAHSKQGAMGLVLNKVVSNITFVDLLKQLRIRPGKPVSGRPILFGGPVETGRGFVLHTPDYSAGDATVKVGQNVGLNVGLTATVDVLKAIADGQGPKDAMLALGYAGWGGGQLEKEIQKNGWLTCPADEYLLFGPELQGKWKYAIRKLGFDPSRLSRDMGQA